jgi:hypothetical protein
LQPLPSLTAVQQQALSLMNQVSAEADRLLCSRDIDDETLVACMDLGRMGLAYERAGDCGEVYFRNLVQT